MGVEILQAAAPPPTLQLQFLAADADLESADGVGYITIPKALDGYRLVFAAATVGAGSTSGPVGLDIQRVSDDESLFSAGMVIAEGDLSTRDGTAPVIVEAYAQVSEGQLLRVDCDEPGTGVTGPAWVELQFAR